ncbi:MAG: TRAP transporter solute receptor, TAXI family [Moorella sp. 60_41]|nr:MAG: TRAP transporter solute receptor, TAXI family [Moorella sp. 60_41]
MRRKYLLLLAGLLMAVMVFLTACGGQGRAGGEGQGQAPRELIFGSGGAGGSWYLLAAQFSEVMKQTHPEIRVTPVESGAIANIRQVNKGTDMDIGLASLPDVLMALGKQGTFAEDDIDNVAPIMNFALDYVHLTVLANSNIWGVEDLADKVICPGPQGFGSEVITRQILELYGLDYEKIKANGGGVSFVTWAEAVTLLKDGHADMAHFKGAVPQANIMELEATHKARVLSIPDDKLDIFLAKYPGYRKGLIPPGTYKGQTEDASTLAHTSVIFVRKDLPEDTVYTLTKVLMENRERFNNIGGINITEKPIEGINPGILHPGAKRYYEEQGIL